MVYVMWYSLGGITLQTGIRHPGVVGRFVVGSDPFSRNGRYPEILAGMTQMGS
jgi:hypothetical protein